MNFAVQEQSALVLKQAEVGESLDLEGGGMAEPWVLLLLPRGKVRGSRCHLPQDPPCWGLWVGEEVVTPHLHHMWSSSAKLAFRHCFLLETRD